MWVQSSLCRYVAGSQASHAANQRRRFGRPSVSSRLRQNLSEERARSKMVAGEEGVLDQAGTMWKSEDKGDGHLQKLMSTNEGSRPG